MSYFSPLHGVGRDDDICPFLHFKTCKESMNSGSGSQVSYFLFDLSYLLPQCQLYKLLSSSGQLDTTLGLPACQRTIWGFADVNRNTLAQCIF